jgi:Transposase zinc-ribbon domain
MKNIFKNIDDTDFQHCFPDEDACLAFLAEQKWADGFACRKCGHTNYCKGKTPYSRRCTKCKNEESASSHTVFHNLRIPLTKAFEIAHMVCQDPEISTYKISDKVHTRQMTCWKFKKKIMECLEGEKKLIPFDKFDVGS